MMEVFRWNKNEKADKINEMVQKDYTLLKTPVQEFSEGVNEFICEDTMKEIAEEVIDGMQDIAWNLIAEYISDMDEINEVRDNILERVKFKM